MRRRHPRDPCLARGQAPSGANGKSSHARQAGACAAGHAGRSLAGREQDDVGRRNGCQRRAGERAGDELFRIDGGDTGGQDGLEVAAKI
jgi:hypothetical protein